MKGSRLWLLVGTGAVVLRGLLDELGHCTLPYFWGQVGFLFAGVALSLSVALGLQEKWHYGFARGLVGVVAALMIGLPGIQIVQQLSGLSLGTLGAVFIMGIIWAAVWVSLRYLARPAGSGT